jgi:hypothetical protein
MAPSMIDPQLFDQLKSKLDEDTKVRKSLNEIIDELEVQIAYAHGLLSRIHGTPRAECLFPFPPTHSIESSH